MLRDVLKCNRLRTLVRGELALAGAAAEQSAVSCSGVKLLRPTILVMGSERRGLRTTIRKACTALVKVDCLHSDASSVGLDSLNVSVAAGILLHALLTSGERKI